MPPALAPREPDDRRTGSATALTPAFAAALAEDAGSPPARRATPAEAFHLARKHFLAGERIDMQALAAELGVSRGTLYRWTGDRDRLLADVMTAIARQTLADAMAATKARGADRCVEVLDRMIVSVANADFLRRFLENDSAVALRILTGRHGGVQDRLIDSVEAMIREEESDGFFHPAVDAHTLAYAAVRLMEAFIYNDTITQLEPNPEQARAVLRLLFRD